MMRRGENTDAEVEEYQKLLENFFSNPEESQTYQDLIADLDNIQHPESDKINSNSVHIASGETQYTVGEFLAVYQESVTQPAFSMPNSTITSIITSIITNPEISQESEKKLTPPSSVIMTPQEASSPENKKQN